MYNVWIMDIRAQPPRIVLHLAGDNRGIVGQAADNLALAFPPPQYTLVHEVNATALDVPEVT